MWQRYGLGLIEKYEGISGCLWPSWKSPHYSPLPDKWITFFPLKISFQFHWKLCIFFSPLSIIFCFLKEPERGRKECSSKWWGIWQVRVQGWTSWTRGVAASCQRRPQGHVSFFFFKAQETVSEVAKEHACWTQPALWNPRSCHFLGRLMLEEDRAGFAVWIN